MTKEEYISKSYSSEEKFTEATYKYVNINYPESRGLFFHVPNESILMQERLKNHGMGVVSGIPDMICVAPLFGLELKQPKKRQSKRQKLIESKWSAAGVPYYVADSPESVVAVLKKHFGR